MILSRYHFQGSGYCHFQFGGVTSVQASESPDPDQPALKVNQKRNKDRDRRDGSHRRRDGSHSRRDGSHIGHDPGYTGDPRLPKVTAIARGLRTLPVREVGK